MEKKFKGAFYPAAEMRVPVTADSLYERVSRGNHTLPGGAVFDQIKQVTPRNWREN